jgi:hypothetical protein
MRRPKPCSAIRSIRRLAPPDAWLGTMTPSGRPVSQPVISRPVRSYSYLGAANRGRLGALRRARPVAGRSVPPAGRERPGPTEFGLSPSWPPRRRVGGAAGNRNGACRPDAGAPRSMVSSTEGDPALAANSLSRSSGSFDRRSCLRSDCPHPRHSARPPASGRGEKPSLNPREAHSLPLSRERERVGVRATLGSRIHQCEKQISPKPRDRRTPRDPP